MENNIILEKIDTLIRIISFTNGVYNLDTELYYSEIALSALQNDIFLDNILRRKYFSVSIIFIYNLFIVMSFHSVENY